MTYNMFLKDFKVEIANTFALCDIDHEGRVMILTALGEQIGKRKLDAVDIFSMFEDVCQRYNHENVARQELLDISVRNAEETYLSGFPIRLVDAHPEITFTEMQEREAMLR